MRALTIAAILLSVLWASPVRAQSEISPFTQRSGDTAPVEVSAAFSMITKEVHQFPDCSRTQPSPSPCSTPKTFPDFGWAVSVARYVNDWLAITGEVSAFAYDEFPSGRREVNHVHAFMAGPKFHARIHSGQRDMRVFGQVLVGTEMSNVISGGLAIQPGGGVDFNATRTAAFRLQFDYCAVQQGGHLSGPRALFGMVLRVGSRKS